MKRTHMGSEGSSEKACRSASKEAKDSEVLEIIRGTSLFFNWGEAKTMAAGGKSLAIAKYSMFWKKERSRTSFTIYSCRISLVVETSKVHAMSAITKETVLEGKAHNASAKLMHYKSMHYRGGI
jgi:hypothetical protein